jgi:hypothetical protein
MKTTTTLIAGLALACGGFAQNAKENPKQVLENLMRQAGEAKAAGRLDEARELGAKAERLRDELQGREGMKKPEKHTEKHPGKEMPHFKGPEAERLHHIMQAAEHLHMAGLHEPAKNIEEMGQHLRRELEERMKREQAEAHGKEGKRMGGEKPQAELEEMRQQMRKMAEMIEQLQVELKKRDADKIQPLKQ